MKSSLVGVTKGAALFGRCHRNFPKESAAAALRRAATGRGATRVLHVLCAQATAMRSGVGRSAYVLNV